MMIIITNSAYKFIYLFFMRILCHHAYFSVFSCVLEPNKILKNFILYCPISLYFQKLRSLYVCMLIFIRSELVGTAGIVKLRFEEEIQPPTQVTPVSGKR